MEGTASEASPQRRGTYEIYRLYTIFQELKKFLYQLLNSVEDLHSILITDRDGVPVVSVSNDKVPELATRASFLSTFAMATDQGSKLGLGKNKTIICMYSSYQVFKSYAFRILASLSTRSKNFQIQLLQTSSHTKMKIAVSGT